jgi:DNA repair photolyase
LVRSITTCDEKIRRLVESGTPPSYSMFKVIKKFTDAGVRCGVNIDPVLPSFSDSPEHVQEVVDSCYDAGVGYVLGGLLRVRSDIWERVKTILKFLNIENGIEIYENTVYQFIEPLKPWVSLSANEQYQTKVLQRLKEKILQKGLTYRFPDRIQSRRINSPKNLSAGGEQVLLASNM